MEYDAKAWLKNPRIQPIGEAAFMVSFGDKIDPGILRCASALVAALKAHPFPGLKEVEASYTGVTVFYDPLVLSRGSHLAEDTRLSKGYREARARVEALLGGLDVTEESARDKVRIPVCYGGEYGPDLEYVAEYHHMTPQEVIDIHTGGDYLVYMIGFAPGFPYVGGLSPKIATPRRDTPRLAIPVGSVGIAGSQTGAYPLETPGGWQLIGRTPLDLFRPYDLSHPSMLEAGDRIEFYSITPEEYEKLKREEEGRRPK
jgi:inhibitor of KinA